MQFQPGIVQLCRICSQHMRCLRVAVRSTGAIAAEKLKKKKKNVVKSLRRERTLKFVLRVLQADVIFFKYVVVHDVISYFNAILHH